MADLIPPSELLKRAQKFDAVVNDKMSKRERERPGISKMHDTAKRTMDETAKRLGL